MKAVWTLFWRHLKPALTSPSKLAGLASRILSLLKTRGLRGTLEKFTHKAELYVEYPSWIALYDTPTSENHALIRARLAKLTHPPCISLLMQPVATIDRQTIKAIESIQAQIYPHWELSIASKYPPEHPHSKALEALATPDPRINILPLPGKSETEILNTLLAAAAGKWIALLDPRYEMAQHTLYWVEEEWASSPDAEIIYTDEDQVDTQGRRSAPCFKPDWNPDLLLSHNYFGNFVFYRAELLRRQGGFRAEAGEAMQWELALRLSDNLPSANIRHIPRVLCHQHGAKHSPPPGTEQKVLETYLRQKGILATVTPGHHGHWRIHYALPSPPPLVSIIIPTRNGLELLARCIDSILEKTAYASFEIIVVDNQSDDCRMLEYLRQLENNGSARVISHDAPFNFSAINNFAAMHARGGVLCFLNNDIEAIHPDWLEELASLAVRPETGAVGAMLYYPDGTVQHAGIVLAGEEDITCHFFAHLPAPLLKTRPRAQTRQNLSAVTGACLAIEKKKFLEIGGFEEKLAVTYNDIDLCLRLRAKGYWNTWTPFAELYHHESATRGFDDSFAKQARIKREKAFMIERWGATLDHDPSYNPNLDPEGGSYALFFRPKSRKLD